MFLDNSVFLEIIDVDKFLKYTILFFQKKNFKQYQTTFLSNILIFIEMIFLTMKANK